MNANSIPHPIPLLDDCADCEALESESPRHCSCGIHISLWPLRPVPLNTRSGSFLATCSPSGPLIKSSREPSIKANQTLAKPRFKTRNGFFEAGILRPRKTWMRLVEATQRSPSLHVALRLHIHQVTHCYVRGHCKLFRVCSKVPD